MRCRANGAIRDEVAKMGAAIDYSTFEMASFISPISAINSCVYVVPVDIILSLSYNESSFSVITRK